MGKGSTPRPFSVANEEYANRWDAIFARDKKEDEKKQQQDAVKQKEKEKK